MVYCTFFIFVRKVIYLKKITADFAVSTMLAGIVKDTSITVKH